MKTAIVVLVSVWLPLSAAGQAPDPKPSVEAPHPPSAPPRAPAGLREPAVPQPEHPLVIATGDFDGDGLADTVERIPGAHANSLRVQVRLASHPDNPYFIIEGFPASMVEATPISVGHAGVYLMEKFFRQDGQFKFCYPDPTQMPSDVVLIRQDRPGWRGFMVKHWAASTDGFVGENSPDADGDHPPECPATPNR